MLIFNVDTVVSRAFQVLSDADKKSKYDQFGGDPDNRFGSGAASASSPFSGFARSASSGGRGPMFDDEISPEELFNRFFGGGRGGGGGGFSPFGKMTPMLHPAATLNPGQEEICLGLADPSLSSILVGVPDSVFINSGEGARGEDLVRQTALRKNGKHQQPPFSPISYLYSSFSFSHFFLLCSRATQLHPVLLLNSIQTRRTPCTENPTITRLITL